MYGRGIIYVLKVMDHAEYNKQKWVEDRGGNDLAPEKVGGAGKTPRSGKPTPKATRGER